MLNTTTAMATATTIARTLRTLRLHAGLTQEQLAMMLSTPTKPVSQQVISQREQDGHLYLHQWPLWSRALRCSLLAVFETGPEGYPARNKRSVNWPLQDYYEALGEDEQETVLRDLRVRAQRQEVLVS